MSQGKIIPLIAAAEQRELSTIAALLEVIRLLELRVRALEQRLPPGD